MLWESFWLQIHAIFYFLVTPWQKLRRTFQDRKSSKIRIFQTFSIFSQQRFTPQNFDGEDPQKIFAELQWSEVVAVWFICLWKVKCDCQKSKKMFANGIERCKVKQVTRIFRKDVFGRVLMWQDRQIYLCFHQFFDLFRGPNCRSACQFARLFAGSKPIVDNPACKCYDTSEYVGTFQTILRIICETSGLGVPGADSVKDFGFGDNRQIAWEKGVFVIRKRCVAHSKGLKKRVVNKLFWKNEICEKIAFCCHLKILWSLSKVCYSLRSPKCSTFLTQTVWEYIVQKS